VQITIEVHPRLAI